jgi:hypothetical protein
MRTLEFPRRALVLPPVLLVVYIALVAVSGAFGAHGAGIHGSSGAFLFAGGALGVLVGLVVELFAVVKGVRILRSSSSSGTVPNLACLAAGAVFLLLAVGWFALGALH